MRLIGTVRKRAIAVDILKFFVEVETLSGNVELTFTFPRMQGNEAAMQCCQVKADRCGESYRRTCELMVRRAAYNGSRLRLLDTFRHENLYFTEPFYKLT
jgi:hypothetical protein